MASSYFYYATSQRPTGVTHSCVGSFTEDGALHLALGKTSRLELHRVTPAGLEPVYDVSLHGRIATMQTVRIGVRACGRGRRMRPAHPRRVAREHARAHA
jgi:hypothetical protein